MYVMNRLRQERGEYAIHSSSVEKNEKAIILFGWKDSGKTTVSLNLCNKYGFKFLSEGRTIVSNDLKVAGRVLHVEKKKTSLHAKYADRRRPLLDESMCSPIDKKPKVGMLVYVQLSPFNEVYRWDYEKSKYHLYGLFTHDIRGESKLLNNYTWPLRDIDTQKLAFERERFVDKLVSEVPVYQIRGSSNFISKKICEFSRKSSSRG